MPGDPAYWVCAYANNQHDLDSELGSGKGPLESSFFKAIKISTGIVSVLDPKD